MPQRLVRLRPVVGPVISQRVLPVPLIARVVLAIDRSPLKGGLRALERVLEIARIVEVVAVAGRLAFVRSSRQHRVAKTLDLFIWPGQDLQRLLGDPGIEDGVVAAHRILLIKHKITHRRARQFVVLPAVVRIA